ncbi:major capsid protein [Moraxella nonliquefaciens]|uniref:Uncharacterized protein n=1 Tax=Moraxella nonliquefaciens TaxID=478 RepID=A0A1B8PL66_MORNO|nr:major capsid protein [Moraxella nonliquefaciens]OBX51699.1 hypothetical protein A9Z60_06775 [Moraxella nonliquefaciens]
MSDVQKAVIIQPKSKLDVYKDKFGRYALVTGVAMSAGIANANTPTAPDLTPIVTMITGLASVVGSIGMAVLTVYATAKVFKWVKTAF